MALSSDEIIKNEIKETLGDRHGNLWLRIFPQSSNDDQKPFDKGGLTFSCDGVDYGSCDAGWYIRKNGETTPYIGLEGTDALNRKSSGNAQYQRFHHALGAVKNDLIGVYYLKKGRDKIQEDLFGMAYFASQHEKGVYLVIDDLKTIRPLVEHYDDKKIVEDCIHSILETMKEAFEQNFNKKYNGSWDKFSERRSTIIYPDKIIKYAGRMKRNFTDSSQRAGHIAVGEMYLTKYFFYGKRILYLMPKMTKEDVKYLDEHKADDKEWYLLRHEPQVELKTMDDINGLDLNIKNELLRIKDLPLKGDTLKVWNKCIKKIDLGLRNGTLEVK